MTIKKPVLGKYGFWTKDSIFVEVKAHNPKEAYLKAKSKYKPLFTGDKVTKIYTKFGRGGYSYNVFKQRSVK